MEHMQFQRPWCETWTKLGSWYRGRKIYSERILLSSTTIIALINLFLVSGWRFADRKPSKRPAWFIAVAMVVILLSVGALVAALVAASVLVSTALIILSLVGNIGLAAWSFAVQTPPSTAE